MQCEEKKSVEAENGTAQIIKKQPIVLSEQRYNHLLDVSNQSEKAEKQKLAEDEERYQEYLKKGSDDLVAQFKGNMPRTQDQKLEQMKENQALKQKEANDIYIASKENDARERNEKIAQAQDLVESLKPGPRSLQAAAVECEMLRIRNIQRCINEEFDRAIEQQEINDKAKCHAQALPFIQEEQDRMDAQKKNINEYKLELFQSTEEAAMRRKDKERAALREEIIAREAVDNEITYQIAREKTMMAQKRLTLRKNALEAMKMTEQRRIREKMAEEVENRLCCAYKAGKRELDTLRIEQAQQVAIERNQRADLNSQRLAATKTDADAHEEARQQRDTTAMQIKFTAVEQEKVRRERLAKRVRIESYLREREQQKDKEKLKEEQRHFDIAQRYKNDEINMQFNQAQKYRVIRGRQETRKYLDDQVAQQKRAAAEERAIEMAMQRQDNCNLKQDRYFFEKAYNMMGDAYQKKRPLHPFSRVVDQYKRDNRIDCVQYIPMHLVSQVQLGRHRQESSVYTNSAALKLARDKANEACDATEKDKESIAHNCLKIKELLATACSTNNNNKKHEANCECFQPSCPLGATRSSADGESLASSSEKPRYSIPELKSLNKRKSN